MLFAAAGAQFCCCCARAAAALHRACSAMILFGNPLSKVVRLFVLVLAVFVIAVTHASNSTTDEVMNHSTNHSSDTHSEHTAHESIIVTLMYPMVILTIGALVEHFFSHSPIPYTVIIFLIGAIIGIIQDSLEGSLEETLCSAANKSACAFGDLSISANQVAEIDPHFLLNVFLPILIFESAFSTDWHVFKNVLGNAALLAGPGLVIASGLTACWVIFCRFNTTAIGSDWETSNRRWGMGLLFGAISSATDPVAVVSVLKTVGASKYLSVTIEGESLLNDGVAVVAFYVLFDAVRFGAPIDGGEVTTTFFVMAGLGVLWGLAMGLIVTSWISLAYDQPMVEITATVMAAYLTYFIGEEYFGVSGVLAVVALGIYFSAVGHYSITPAVLHELHGLWEWLGFLANTLVFGITGVLITRPTIQMLQLDSASNWASLLGNCVTLNLALLLIRALVFLMFFPVLHFCGKQGYKMDWRDCFISTWGALRGAVGLALAMVVSLDARARDVNGTECSYEIRFDAIYVVNDDGLCGGILLNGTTHEDIQADVISYKKFSEHMLIGVVSVVCFTLLFNSTTIKPLMACLKMNELSDIQLRLFEMAMEKIDDAAVNEIDVLREATSLQGVDWETVRASRYEVTRRNDLAMSKSLLERLRSKRRATIMKSEAAKLEARRRFLAACMSSYHKQNEQAVLSGRSLRILTEANNDAIDHDCGLHEEWLSIVKSVPFLGLVDYMATVENEDLFKCDAGVMFRLIRNRQWHVFLLLLHLRTRKNRCMNWIVGRFVVSSIGRACDTASAFMGAREDAIDLLRHYLEQEANYSTFYTTAQADMAIAARAVLCCQRFFPDIVRSAETNRATRIILYLQKTRTLGLIEEGVLDPVLGSKVVHSLDERIKSVMLSQRLCPKLSSNTKHVLLNEIAWLRGLPADVMHDVEASAVTHEFQIDDVIVDFGQRPEYIYVIVHGSVSIHMDMQANTLGSSMKALLDEGLLEQAENEEQKAVEKHEAAMKRRKSHGPSAVYPADHAGEHGDGTNGHGHGGHGHGHGHGKIQRRRSQVARRLSKKMVHKAGSTRDLFLGKMKLPVVQLHTGSSIGELSWINERASRTKFCARASSTTVELIGIPINFVKNCKPIQESLWMTTGRKIVETVLSKQGRFKTWPKQQLVREVSKWKITQTAKLASQNHYTAVSFCMPVVLMHGEAFKLKHRCRVTKKNEQDPTLGDFQIIMTQREMMEAAEHDHVLGRLDGPRYLRPHVADDRIDDTTATTVTWYIRSESWLCYNDHARFHYITGAGEAARDNSAYSNMRNVFRQFVLGHDDINAHMATDADVARVAQEAGDSATALSMHAAIMMRRMARKGTWRVAQRLAEIQKAKHDVLDDNIDGVVVSKVADLKSGSQTAYSPKAAFETKSAVHPDNKPTTPEDTRSASGGEQSVVMEDVSDGETETGNSQVQEPVSPIEVSENSEITEL